MLQDTAEPYEVVLCLFNAQEPHFLKLAEGRNPLCDVIIRTFEPPSFFNISAANNLGLHFARGTFVLFANSDTVYPSHYLSTFVGELRARSISYALGSRTTIPFDQTRALGDAVGHHGSSNYDFLVGQEHRPGRYLGQASSPWTIRREVAWQVGGFDPMVTCHEDSEFNDRVIHYLRRNCLQQCIFAVTGIYGYHLSHPASELYGASQLAKQILEPRRTRLMADPLSCEDVLPTDLGSLPALENDMRTTRNPSPAARWRPGRVFRSAARRSREALDVLVHG
jgi:hypothetical protein